MRTGSILRKVVLPGSRTSSSQAFFWACMNLLQKEAPAVHQRITEKTVVNYSRSELFDAMNKLAPPGFYFGMHPKDNTNYGFWLRDTTKLTANEVLDKFTSYLINNKGGEKPVKELIEMLEHCIWLLHHTQ